MTVDNPTPVVLPDAPAITRGQYRVVSNGAENFVMEWLDANGRPKGTARPATPQEYEMFASLNVAITTLQSLMRTNEELREQNGNLADACTKQAGRLSVALDLAAELAEHPREDRPLALAKLIERTMASVNRMMAQDA